MVPDIIDIIVSDTIRFRGAPPAPILRSPDASRVLQSPFVTFTWDAGQGTPKATSFQICITEADKSCSEPGAQIYSLIPATARRFFPPTGLPARFQGKRLKWSVAACAPNRQRPALGGGFQESCTYATPRPLAWALPPPTLHAAGGLDPFRPHFSCTSVIGAESYLFCISKPGIACPPQPTNTRDTLVVEQRGQFANHYTPSNDQVLERFAGQTVHWTAAACNAAFGCVYQRQVEAITFPPLPSPPTLVCPADNHQTVSRRQTFSWQAVSGATSYKLCVSPPGVGCGTAGSHEQQVATTTAAMDIPQSLGPVGTQLYWTVAACNATGQCVYQRQVRALTIGAGGTAPSLSLHPRWLTVGTGQTKSGSLQLWPASAVDLDITLVPQNENIAINGQTPGSPVTITIPSNATSQMFHVTGVRGGGSRITVPCFESQTVSQTISVLPIGSTPSAPPNFSLNVAPRTQTVEWGQSSTFQVDVQGRNEFSGTIHLSLHNVPAGVQGIFSPNPVTIGPAQPMQTSTLTLTTLTAATAPGRSTIQVRGTTQGLSPWSTTVTLNVQRMSGSFDQVGVLGHDETCGNVSATYWNAGSAADPDIRVEFAVNLPSGRVQTQPIPAAYYALSPPPHCRVGVVIHPYADGGEAAYPALSWYNLGLNPNIGAPDICDLVETLPGVLWHQFWFSPDQTLLLLIARVPSGAGTLNTHVAWIFDAATNNQLCQEFFSPQLTGSIEEPIASVSSAILSGDTVTIAYIDASGQTSTMDCGVS